MNVDSDIVPEGSVLPRSFGGLMALYECNYIRLTELIGDRVLHSPAAISYAREDFPVQLTVEKRSRYTRVLRMTYALPACGGVVLDPDLRVRLYLDARVAEVAGWAAHHHHGMLLSLRKRYGRELDRRWSRNMMLCKWLEYLHDHEHHFAPTEEPESVAEVAAL